MGGSLKEIYMPNLKSCSNNFISLTLYKFSQISHPSPRVTSTSNRTKTNHHWLNHLQTLHALNCATSLTKRLRGELSNPWGNTRKS